MLTLYVLVAGNQERFVFDADAITIGRNVEADLRIGSRFVSQIHCRIERHGKGWRIVDLKSQNGTTVNGLEITQKSLKAGDRIEVGHIPIFMMTAPDQLTESLLVGTDELTPVPGDHVVVSARDGSGARGELDESLSAVVLEYRKEFGDERGVQELESAVTRASEKIFTTRAFAPPLDSARLMEIAQAINSELNLKRCLSIIMDSVVELTGAERGFLILDDERFGLKVKIARNFDEESVTHAEMKFSHSIAEKIRKSGVPMVTSSALTDQRFEGFQSVEELKLKSVLCLPFRLRSKTIGLIYLDHRFQDGAFSEASLEVLSPFTDQAAVAIENARLYEENKAVQIRLEERQKEIDTLNSFLDQRLADQDIESGEIRSFAPKKSEFKFDYSFIVGESPALLDIFHLLDRVIPTEAPVLISGESGTGKELIATALHRFGERADRPFIKENCAAIPESLLESELFGYKKGAFTGADSDRRGLFEEASGGTLFLDEIGEISAEMQKKLLRALQEGEIRPVGGRERIKVDVRIITASNRDLKQEMDEGRFREDLFYRINVIGVHMPPLRERLEDIPLLVQHFLDKETQSTTNGPERSVDSATLQVLLKHPWRGNIRELENEVRRACAMGGSQITAADFSREITQGRTALQGDDSDPSNWKTIVRETAQQKEREIILRALEEADWKKAATARNLGISRPTLDGKIKVFGLAPFIRRGKASRQS